MYVFKYASQTVWLINNRNWFPDLEIMKFWVKMSADLPCGED